MAEFQARYESLAKKWCEERGIDFEATVKNYEKHLGPSVQERDSPIPGTDKEYTVFSEKHINRAINCTLENLEKLEKKLKEKYELSAETVRGTITLLSEIANMNKQTKQVIRNFLKVCRRAQKYLEEHPPENEECFPESDQLSLVDDLDCAIGMAGIIIPTGMTLDKFLQND